MLKWTIDTHTLIALGEIKKFPFVTISDWKDEVLYQLRFLERESIDLVLRIISDAQFCCQYLEEQHDGKLSLLSNGDYEICQIAKIVKKNKKL